MNDAIWPIFIAAPFISPSTEAIFSAVSMCRRLEALLGLLVGADHVGRGGPRVAGRLAADRGPELRGAPDPGLGDLALPAPRARAARRAPCCRGRRAGSLRPGLSLSSREPGPDRFGLCLVAAHRPPHIFYPGARAYPAWPYPAGQRHCHDGTGPSHTQSLAARGFRLAGHPPPAPGGPGAGRRLRPGRRGAPLPGSGSRPSHRARRGPDAARPRARRLQGRSPW